MPREGHAKDAEKEENELVAKPMPSEKDRAVANRAVEPSTQLRERERVGERERENVCAQCVHSVLAANERRRRTRPLS